MFCVFYDITAKLHEKSCEFGRGLDEKSENCIKLGLKYVERSGIIKIINRRESVFGRCKS